MATNKNITMKQFNGVDYDTLYPKTTVSQVEGAYGKNEVDAAIAAADPMGPWKYAGKFTGFGESNKIEVTGLTGGTFSSLVNQILLKINNIKNNDSGTAFPPLYLTLNSIEANNNKSTMNIILFSSQGMVSALIGSKFLFNKVGVYANSALYSPTSYTRDGELSNAYRILASADITKIEAYLYWAYSSYITELDADLYFR